MSTGPAGGAAEAKGVDLAGLTLAEMQAVGAAYHRGRVFGPDGGGIGRVADQRRRHGTGECRARGSAMAGSAGMRWALFLALILMLTACGKKGPPSPPGPPDQITFPRTYPTH